MKNTRFFLSLTAAQQRKFMAFASAYGDAYARGNDNRDERLLSLPHHKRIAINDAIALEARFLEEFAPAVIAEAKRPGASRRDIALAMVDHYPDLTQAMYQDRTDILCDVGLRLMVHFGRVRTFQTTDALETLLQGTDVGHDIPASWFRTPFEDCYIEFGEHRRHPVTISDPGSGEHIVEGVYLLTGESFPIDGSKTLVRGYDLIIFGSASGKKGVMDDCFVHMGFPIGDETASISDLVNQVVAYYAAKSQFRNAEAFRPVVEHVAKILVYMGTKEARQIEVSEGSQALRRASGLKSPAKRAKALRQAIRLYDRIVIGPEGLPSTFSDFDTARTAAIRPHVRRGHFRSQAYGPQHSLRRPQWIQPMLVCKERFVGGTHLPTYTIHSHAN